VLYGYDQSSVTMVNKYNIVNSIGRLSWSAPVDQNFRPIAMDAFSYDPLGRTKQFWQETPANRGVKDQVICYDYDLTGNPVDFFVAANQAASQGVIEQLTYDGAGRLTTFFENVTAAPSFSTTMISGITYNALGQRTSATFANGLTQSWKYNNRGSVTSMAAGTGCSAGSCTTTKYGYTLGYAPNGNVTSANDTVNGNWNYAYDALNRLVCANLAANGTCPTTGTPTYSYTYDRFGNRLKQTGPITFNASFTGNNNRIDGYCYDAAGNLLDAAPCPTGANSVHAFKYDAENRLVISNQLGTNYIYDADGRRVEKATGSTLEDYLYDKDGNILSNWITNSPSYAEYYANGWHFLSEYINAAHTTSTMYFEHSDWLGTERMRSDINGNIYETCSSLPFGDNLNCVGPTDVSPMHFTGKERDPESGLDNFGARYYANTMGRFMSPDWASKPTAVPYAMFGDPQSINLYSYVGNNPLSHADVDGHCWPFCGLAVKLGAWVGTGVATQGGKQFATNVGIGAAKGAGTFALNTARTAVAIGQGSSPGGAFSAVQTMTAPLPSALTPSNQTQAQVSTATQITLTVASIVAPATIESASATATTTLFRAVGPAEAESIEAGGAFSGAPNGTMFKGFFFNQSDAESFGQAATRSFGEETSVYSTEAPTDLVNASPPHNAAGEGPGVLIPNKNLNQLTPPRPVNP
jgi:RHS repeat-associated protein